MRMKVYDEQIYVTDIECVATGLVSGRPGENYQYNFKILFQPGASVEIKSYVKPDDATYGDVEYYYDTDKDFVTVTTPARNTAVVTFNDVGAILLNVRSTDGKNVEKCVRIYAHD